MTERIQFFGSPGMLVLLVGCAGATTPEQQFLADALGELGGRAGIESVKSIVIGATGTNHNLGPGHESRCVGTGFEITNYKRQIDIGRGTTALSRRLRPRR